MTTAPQGRIPALTLGWRLKMALSEGDVTREKMAERLGVTPSTCSRWMSDRGAPPRRAYIAEWAAVTGVSLDWLEHGTGSPGPNPPGTTLPEGDRLAALTERKRRRTGGSPTIGVWDTAA